jgi:hypothetical protein
MMPPNGRGRGTGAPIGELGELAGFDGAAGLIGAGLAGDE